ncbi:MAG: response regulator [Phenylobacterium sp.]|uniref:response regulator n=1 Tax=Phenylobacterium sp. TaxID=1871053 RepID=UPI001B649A8C|nr:response regulator [Phenylobacterium sp.]MBP7651227.1 response regulator [Phenylobacterium sp.]MBP7817438.1 response regulator [Phenylobacterium sp.]MBP9232040.1 response regulator [Phenylobacterium sp.]MBP9756153.1 response regulator [Phenylobacterium sp.]
MAGAGTSGWIGRLLRGLGRRLADHAVAAAEADAATARDRLREAIDLLPEGVVFLDAEGRYILWNKRYAEIYHRSADLFRAGAPFSATLKMGVARGDYPEAIGREEAWLAERMDKLMNPTGERHEQRISDGRWLMIEEKRTADGGVIGLRVDITAMKQQAVALEEALRRAEAASHAKTEFLADMSHELRTPLNGVLGLGQALAASDLSEHQRALLSDMLASAQDLDGLVNGLLDYGDRARAADAAPASPAPSDVPPLRVLAADDNPTNRKVVELMLGAAGAQVVSVENGQQAVDAWRAGAFDVVLMDLRMPVMDGLDAIRAIRKAEGGGLPRAPIIVISANTSATDVEASAAAGADRHIGKPLRAEDLFEAISGVLD